MDDFLTLIIIIFVVVSLYWQYHSYTNTNSLLYRIKQLEEKLTEQQAKLFKLLNKKGAVDERTALDASKDEVGDLSCEIKRELKSTSSSNQSQTSTLTEGIQDKVENMLLNKHKHQEKRHLIKFLRKNSYRLLMPLPP